MDTKQPSRRHIQSELTDSEPQNQNSCQPFNVRSMPVMILVINPAGEIIDLSNVWLEKTGYQRGEVLGRRADDFLKCQPDKTAVHPERSSFSTIDSCRDIPCTLMKKGGENIEVLLSASTERDGKGAMTYAQVVLVEVAESNGLRTELRAGESLYRSMIQGMLNGFALHEVICNETGQPINYRFLEVNSAFERIIGLTSDQLVGRTVLEVLPKTESYWIETFGRVALHRQPIHFENFSVELQRYFDVLAFSPAEMQFAVVTTDITDRKHTEIITRHSEELFRRTFDQSPIGAAMVGLDYRFLKVNQELCRITGYPEEELLRLRFAEITYEEDVPAARQQAGDLTQGIIDHYEMDLRYLRKNGKKVWIRLSVRLIRDNHDTPLYFLPMMVEIDARKRLEEEKDVQLELFRLISEDSNLDTVVEAVLSFFKTWSNVDAVAIRFRQGRDFPYYKTFGFPEEFVRRENSLHSMEHRGSQRLQPRDQTELECMCGCVINGLGDSTRPFFTAGGSFCTNSTTELLKQSEGFEMPSRMRNHCHEAGYESVLLIPLKVGDNTLGLIQFNHKSKDFFAPEFVSLMERLVGHISVAVAQRLTEEELKAKHAELMEMNVALKVLIRSREEDLLEHDRGIMIHIRQLILPCIERLKLGSLDIQQRSQLNILESNLETVTSPFAKELSSPNTALTPALIQVADMIKKGISNKEIARLLGISVHSVETYRKRIRERLSLRNSRINLRAYLTNMQ